MTASHPSFAISFSPLRRALNAAFCEQPAPRLVPRMAGLLLAASSGCLTPLGARANCLIESGGLVTCSASAPNPYTKTIGAGPNTASGVSVVLEPNANITTGDANAISLGDNASIVVNAGATVTNHAVSAFGLYYTGADTIEFRNGGTLTVNTGGTVLSTGTQYFAEAVNIEGLNNLVVNNGLIRGTGAAAIWFQNTYGTNTVLNNQGGVIEAPASVIGSTGNGSVVFTNKGTVVGNLSFAGGNDRLNLYTGSSISGSFNGGGGVNAITLDGAGTGSLPGAILNFQTLLKSDTGTWTLTGAISGALAVEVAQGKLILAGNNAGFTGSVLVDTAGTLQGTSGTLAPVIHDNGLVLFAQPQTGTFSGTVSGTGAVTKTGAGVLTLAGANSYAGGTNLDGGSVAIRSDNALGAATGGVTFDSGTLLLLGSLNLAPGRTVTLAAGGGIIDTQGFSAMLSQGIVGAGALTKSGSGTLILAGNSVYAGGTTIGSGVLQLGSGGSSGSLAGNVVNNGTLAFDRADVSEFSGVVSGTGALRQAGSGTTALTGENTYRGGTTIVAGTLQLGAGGSSGGIIGNVTDQGTLAFDRNDIVTFAGQVTGTGGLTQDGPGTTILSGASSYAGTTAVEVGTLQLDGSITSATLVQSGATLSGTGQIAGSLRNAGVVAPGDPGQIGTLTVDGNYSSTAGVLSLRSLLNQGGPGNQVTDRLLIAGNASGTTLVNVIPLPASAGGITGNSSVDGISVIQVAGSSPPASFLLDHPYVAGGPYEYQLFEFPHGASSASAVDPKLGALGVSSINDYRLQTVIVQPAGPAPGGQYVPQGLPVGVGPNGEAVGQAVVLPQIPAYRAVPTASLAFGYALVDDYHRRLGETAQEDPGATGESFLRANGWHGDYLGHSGPNFDESYSFVQAGLGRLWHDLVAPGDTVHVDAIGSIGHVDLTIRPNGVNPNFDGYALGASATYQAAAGWYLDSVLMENLYRDIHIATREGPVASFGGHGLTASLEGGYPVALYEGTIVEPRASVAWQHVAYSAFTDRDLVGVAGNDLYSLQERLGVRVQKTFLTGPEGSRSISPFVTLDYYHDARGAGQSALGNVPFAVDGIGNALRLALGMNAQLSRAWAFYGEFGRSVARGGGGIEGNQLNIGMRLSFQ